MVSHKEVFKATITVEGKLAETGEPGTETVTIYHEDFADMLDGLVQASVTIYDRITDRIQTVYSDYTPKDGQWHILISYPDVAQKATTSLYSQHPKGLSYSHPKETTLEGRILDFKDIVRFTVLVRHLRIAQMASYLLLARPAKSEISDVPKKPFQGIDNARNVQEMTEYGFTGIELIIMIMRANGEFRLNREGKIVRNCRKQVI